MRAPVRKRTGILLVLIFLCALVFIYTDFARFFHPAGPDFTVHFRSLFFKGGVVLFTTLLIFFIGIDGLSLRDTRRMRLMAVLVIVADIMLLMGKTAVGIVVFGAVQSILMRRNSRYFIRGFRHTEEPRRRLLGTVGAVLLLWTVLLQFFVFYPLLEGKAVQWIIIAYALFVSGSAWVAVANFLLRLFPRPNSTLVVIGMLCFLLCDLNVGLLLSLSQGVPRLLAESLIWVFYTPALTCLALSGYDYQGDKKEENALR